MNASSSCSSAPSSSKMKVDEELLLVHQRDHAWRQLDALAHNVLETTLALLDETPGTRTKKKQTVYCREDIHKAGKRAIAQCIQQIQPHTKARAGEDMDCLVPLPQSEAKNMDKGERCIRCQWLNPQDAVFCGGCGRHLESINKATTTQEEERGTTSTTRTEREGTTTSASVASSQSSSSVQQQQQPQVKHSFSGDEVTTTEAAAPKTTGIPTTTAASDIDRGQNTATSQSRDRNDADESNGTCTTAQTPTLSAELQRRVNSMNMKEMKNVIRVAKPENQETILKSYGKEDTRVVVARLLAENPNLLEEIAEKKKQRAIEHVEGLNVKGLKDIVVTAGYSKDYLSDNGIVDKEDLRRMALRLVNQNPQLIRLATSARRGEDNTSGSIASSSVFGESSAAATQQSQKSHSFSDSGNATPVTPPVTATEDTEYSRDDVRKAESKWIQTRDNEGREYFYHADTRITRWEKPTGQLAAKMEARFQAEKQAAEERSQVRLQRLQQSDNSGNSSADPEKLRSQVSTEVAKWAKKAGWPGNKVTVSEKKLKGKNPADILQELLISLPDLLGPYLTSSTAVDDFMVSTRQLKHATAADKDSLLKKTYMKTIRVVHPDKMVTSIDGESEEDRIKGKAISEFTFSVLSACNNYCKGK
eukprot:gb/GECG01000541.1/.p1 GENE.gb/GECG01000541.1/~~gb/GECG01000541.1/.p1  ORF type:complete len:647 (+),score=105.58 gb/GECG01000541.1/:1-1941(+)